MYVGNFGFIEPIVNGDIRRSEARPPVPRELPSLSSLQAPNDPLQHPMWCLDLYVASGYHGTTWRTAPIDQVLQFLNNTRKELFQHVLCDAYALAGMLGRSETTTSLHPSLLQAYVVPHMDSKVRLCAFTSQLHVTIIGTRVYLSDDIRRRVRSFHGCDQRSKEHSDAGQPTTNFLRGRTIAAVARSCVETFASTKWPQERSKSGATTWRKKDFHHAPIEQLVAHVARSQELDEKGEWDVVCDVLVVSALSLAEARMETRVVETDEDFLLINPTFPCVVQSVVGGVQGRRNPVCNPHGLGRNRGGYFAGTSNTRIAVSKYLVLAKLTNRTLVLPPSQIADHYYDSRDGRSMTNYMWSYDSELLALFVRTISWTSFVQHMLLFSGDGGDGDGGDGDGGDGDGGGSLIPRAMLGSMGTIDASLSRFPWYVDQKLFQTKQYELFLDYYETPYYSYSGFQRPLDVSKWIGGRASLSSPKVLSFNGAGGSFFSRTYFLSPDDTASMLWMLQKYFVELPQVAKTVNRVIHHMLQPKKQQKSSFKALQIRLGDFSDAVQSYYWYQKIQSEIQPDKLIRTMKQHGFEEEDVIYMSTTPNAKLIKELQKNFINLRSLKDLGTLMGADCNVDTNIRGPLCASMEQQLCVRASSFIGSGYSTFGNNIVSYRAMRKESGPTFSIALWTGQAELPFVGLMYKKLSLLK